MQEHPLPVVLWAYRFDAAGRGAPLAPGTLDAVLASADDWAWLHLNLANARARDWLRTAPIAGRARELLLDDEEVPALCGLDGAGVGVLVDLKREFDRSSDEIARLRFALTERLIITCRRHPLSAVEAVHGAVERGEVFVHPAALVEAIFERFARAVALIARDLNNRLDVIEDRVVLSGESDESERLGEARRTALRLHRQLIGQCNLLSTAVAEEEATLPPALFAVVERAERRSRALDRDVETVQERARALQDELAARAAATTNRNLFALSIVTALFLPATLVTGLFGMNTGGVPWVEDAPNGFWFAALLAAAGSAAVYLLLRRLGVTR